MYAVVELQGHQYIVANGHSIVVDKLDAPEGQELIVKPLAVFKDDGSLVEIGMPTLEKAQVLFTVWQQHKEDKINVTKFKRKTRYERHIGFRAQKHTLEVKNITL